MLRAAGNTVSSRNLSIRKTIQAKVRIGEPDDQYEQEADRIADRVMRMSAPPQPPDDVSHTDAKVQRKCAACRREDEEIIRRKPVDKSRATDSLASAPATSILTGGRSLSFTERGFFEPRFQRDFSDVRIHNDSHAHRAASALKAKAFTVGRDIAFAKDYYAPHTQEGRRLLAHELTHVLQQQSRRSPVVIQRDDLTPDWRYEADRLTLEELESEVRGMRSVLLTELSDSEENEYLSGRLAVFEEALLTRQRGRIRLRELVGAVRQGHRAAAERSADEPAAAVANNFLTQRSAEALFVAGFVTGYATEIPPGELQDFIREMQEHGLEFYGGYLVGLPVGLWHGLTGLIEGIWMLVRIGSRLTPQGMLLAAGEELSEFAGNPEGYIAERRRQYRQLRDIAIALHQFGEEFRADPTIVIQLSADLGLALGTEFGDWVTTGFLRQSPYDKGFMVGDIAGQILFEVLLEIILAVATEGIGNVLRGVAGVGQGARQGGRVARILRRMLEASPALRRLLRAIAGSEDLADIARLGEHGADFVRGGGDEALEGASRISSGSPPVGGSSRGAGSSRFGHRGASAEGTGGSFSYEYHPETPAPVVEHGRVRGGAEGGGHTPSGQRATPEPPAERWQDLPEGIEDDVSRGVVDRGEDVGGSTFEASSHRSPASTFHERVRQTPAEGPRGTWVGTRGDGVFVPSDPQVASALEARGLDGIVYRNGYPDFSDVAELELTDIPLTADRDANFARVFEELADRWNITPAQAEARVRSSGWTIHEVEDRGTIQLVDSVVHGYFGHYGAVGEERLLRGL